MTKLPYIDFGGEGQSLHFAHPNAYPPACFRQFCTALTADYRVVALEQRPLWPKQQPEALDSIQRLADDMIDFFDQNKLTDVIGVGHSLGGVVTMMTAVKRPDLFSKLVLLDPVFMAPSILEMAAGVPDGINPYATKALNRRNRWPDRQTAFDHFRPKKVFGLWSDAALWDFVETSIVPDGTGQVGLRFTREWESRFYTLVMSDGALVWELLPQLDLPTLAVRAGHSDTLFPEAWALWREIQPETTFVEMPEVGHMFTMERPLPTAQLVLNWLAGK